MKMIIIAAVIAALVLAGCAPAAESNGKLKVIATTGMIGDAAKVIGGDKVEVQTLMGPGVDPHLYKASEGDIQKLAGADVILYSGIHLEGKMVEILEQMARSKTAVAVAENIPEELLIQNSAFAGQYDPHVWFDVSMWKHAVQAVADTLSEKDPENAAYYEANAKAYLAQLDELDSYAKTKVAELPEDKRVLVTAHDAFSYFGRRYGLTVKGLQGISTQSEAGAKDVQDLAEFIASSRIKAVFIESSIPERNIKAVQQAVEAKGWNVVVGGELFSDAMGNEGTFEGTYIGMVTHNVDNITGGLK